jgi:hypothetical protein
VVRVAPVRERRILVTSAARSNGAMAKCWTAVSNSPAVPTSAAEAMMRINTAGLPLVAGAGGVSHRARRCGSLYLRKTGSVHEDEPEQDRPERRP